jgi:competence protein ComEA
MGEIILLLKQFGLMILIGIAGLMILGYGLWSQLMPQETTVEVVKAEEQVTQEEIVVEVAGEVIKPGIYKLPAKSRIGDALVLAGGLSAEADRLWVSQNINLAEHLKDGIKIYLPSEREGKNSTKSSENKININTAAAAELDSLEGIGESRANTIIENRPYFTIDELVSKAKVPKSVVDKIKDQISVH